MSDKDLDDILDDALKDFEDEEAAQPEARPLFQTPSTQRTSSNLFTPTSEEKNPFAQESTPLPSSKEFLSFVEQLNKTKPAKVPNLLDDQQQPASSTDGDAELDLDKIFESMSDDEKKLVNQFAQDMEKFFGDMEKNKDKPAQQTPTTTTTTTTTPQQGDNASNNNTEDMLKASIEQTLKLLAQNSQNLKDVDPNSTTTPTGEDSEDVKKLMGMFEKMMKDNTQQQQGTEQGPEDEKMFSFLEKIMETLMSPDVLRQPMSQLKDKYPQWLEKNKGKISQEEFSRVQKQYEYASKICDVYATEQFPACLPKLIELMKNMQALGQPPEELISELNVEGNSIPKLPEMPTDCSIM